MKTTVEIPDALFRRAKSAAAERGISLRVLLTEALTEKLSSPKPDTKQWMAAFGQLKHLHEDNVQIQALIDEEFGQIEPEEWK